MNPSIRREERRRVRAALIGLMALLVGLGLMLNIERLPLIGGGRTYHAVFSDSAGLKVGEEVRVAGIKVGKVTDIELKGDTVRVTFTVDDVTVGSKSTAGIELKTLLGQHYLSLTSAGSGELEDGSTIDLERTTTPVNIVPAFQRLGKQSAEIDTDQAAESFEAIADVLSKTAPELGSTLRGVVRLSKTVSTRDGEIRQLLSRSRSVMGTVADRDDEVADLITDLDHVLGMLQERRATITSIIRTTASVSGQLRGLVRDNEAALAPTLRDLNGVVAVLKRNRKSLDTILENAALYGREFVNVGGSGRWFDATIKVPQGFALCQSGSAPDLLSVLGPVLSRLNQAMNGSDQPCLPLGPATGGAS